ncbi:MAG: hypothetical protein ACOC2U_02610 [bacterium]
MKSLLKFYTRIISILFIVNGLFFYLPESIQYSFLREVDELSYRFYTNIIITIAFILLGMCLWFSASKLSLVFTKENYEEDFYINNKNIKFIKKISLYLLGFFIIYNAIPDLISITVEKKHFIGLNVARNIKIICYLLRIIIGIGILKRSKDYLSMSNKRISL